MSTCRFGLRKTQHLKHTVVKQVRQQEPARDAAAQGGAVPEDGLGLEVHGAKCKLQAAPQKPMLLAQAAPPSFSLGSSTIQCS